MRSFTPWLLVLSCAVTNAARGDTNIYVIQPGTTNLVSHVAVEVYSAGASPQRIGGGQTGLHAEPVVVKLDPAWQRVRVVATRQGVTGSTELTYDRDLTPWNRPYRQADWRPATVYDNRRFAEDQWQPIPYDDWKQQLRDWRGDATKLGQVLKQIAKLQHGAAELPTLAAQGQSLLAGMNVSGTIHGFLIDSETGHTTPVGRTLEDVQHDLKDLLTAPQRSGGEDSARTFLEVQASLADAADRLDGERNRTVYPPDLSVLMPQSMIPAGRIYCNCAGW
jgi:hypothetical protein